MPWLKTPQKKHELLFLSSSGREYVVGLSQLGIVEDSPPKAAYELDDGTIEALGVRYLSLADLASAFGCLLGDFRGLDEVN